MELEEIPGGPVVRRLAGLRGGARLILQVGLLPRHWEHVLLEGISPSLIPIDLARLSLV